MNIKYSLPDPWHLLVHRKKVFLLSSRTAQCSFTLWLAIASIVFLLLAVPVRHSISSVNNSTHWFHSITLTSKHFSAVFYQHKAKTAVFTNKQNWELSNRLKGYPSIPHEKAQSTCHHLSSSPPHTPSSGQESCWLSQARSPCLQHKFRWQDAAFWKLHLSAACTDHAFLLQICSRISLE